MKLDIKCKTVVNIDIDCEEAFRILVKTLHMDYILKDEDFRVHNNNDGELCVYKYTNGYEELFDDRGDLYKSLMEVAINIFPNI